MHYHNTDNHLNHRNVLLYFSATVSALVCLVCSSTVVGNYDDDDDDDDDDDHAQEWQGK